MLTALPRLARRLSPVPVVALAAHAVVYGTAMPHDGLHGYFGWYEPTVTLASVLALALVAVSALARIFGTAPPRLVRPRAGSRVGLPARGAQLALAGTALLVAQETLERSAARGALAPPQFGLREWALLAASCIGFAFLLAALAHAGAAMVDHLAGAPAPFRFGRPAVADLTGCSRPAPLSARLRSCSGPRAPPVFGV